MVDPNLQVTTVVSGLNQPTSMAFLGSGDFLVLEKATGKVQHVVNGVVVGTALDLAVKMSGTLNDMTFAVERMNGVRQALDDRAGRLPAGDGVAKRLRAASAIVDSLRKKIVATKEGGMITGEERLRENLTDLYSNIIFYDGGPSQTQIERADAVARELTDVVRGFDAWATGELAGINAALRSKKLEPITVLSRQQWEAAAQ